MTSCDTWRPCKNAAMLCLALRLLVLDSSFLFIEHANEMVSEVIFGFLIAGLIITVGMVESSADWLSKLGPENISLGGKTSGGGD